MSICPFLKRCWHRIIGTPPPGAWTRLAGVAGALVLLAGCSLVGLGYNRLPDLGLLWLNQRLPLTDAQTAQVRADMAELLAWHRRTQLPATADLLRRWQAMATADIGAADACREWAQVRGLLDTLAQQAVPALARLASTLTAEQIVELQRSQRQDNDAFREANSAVRRGWFAPAHAATPAPLNAQAGLDKRLDTLRDRYRQLYGSLTDAQVDLLRQSLQASAFEPERTLAERERRQAELLDGLRAPPPSDPAEARKRVQAWLAGLSDSPLPGHNAYAQRLIRDGCEQFAALHRTTDAGQRAHAVRTLKAHETDLRALSRQGN